MPGPETATLGQNYTWTTQTSDTAGAPVDADSLPTYKVYEDETGTEILSGTMAKLDDANTVGFYSEELAITSANGFDLHQSYHIRVVTAISTTAVAVVIAFRVISTALSVTATTGALTTTANFKTYAGISGSDDDALIAVLIARATSAIDAYCDRTLLSTTYRERFDGTGHRDWYATQYPITAITLLSVGISDAIKITNSSSDAWNAFVTVDATNMTLTINGGGDDGSDVLTLANYTGTTLVAAITALTKGWVGELLLSDYGVWDATELLPADGLSMLNNSNQSNIAYVQFPNSPEDGFRFDADAQRRVYLSTGFPIGRQNIVIRYTAGYTTTPADLEQICIDLVNTYYQSRKTDSTVKRERLGDHDKTYADEGGGGARDIPKHLQNRLAPYKRMRMG